MTRLIAFNKPYGVLSQFSKEGEHPTLADYIDIPNVYPAGRLDRDSEGLLLLTDDGKLQQRISDPKFKKFKTYWVEVEKKPDETALQQLRDGVTLKDGLTRPAKVKLIDEPDIWQRDPPVRFRKNVPTAWLALSISEGKNRQVRRMTAAVGYPTLRLVRARVGDWQLGDLELGQWRELDINQIGSKS